jgi:hypothetical protein
LDLDNGLPCGPDELRVAREAPGRFRERQNGRRRAQPAQPIRRRQLNLRCFVLKGLDQQILDGRRGAAATGHIQAGAGRLDMAPAQGLDEDGSRGLGRQLRAQSRDGLVRRPRSSFLVCE